jgi:hypothetical protein
MDYQAEYLKLKAENQQLKEYIASEEQTEEEFFEDLDKQITEVENKKGFWIFRAVAGLNAAITVFKKVRQFIAYRRKRKQEKTF